MRAEERRLLRFALVGGAAAALLPVLYLSSLVVWGSRQTPSPMAATVAAPALLQEALWARAGGGRATELRGMNPFNLAGLMLCSNLNGAGDNETGYLHALDDVVARGQTHAERMLERYHGAWGGDLRRVYAEESF